MNTPKNPIEIVLAAQEFAMSMRPKVGGFPVLAEVLRQAGVRSSTWTLPACQSVYVTTHGNVVSQGTPLLTGWANIPCFDQEKLIVALRTDQAGNSSFPEFLEAAWQAGVVRYDVDFENRTVTYIGILGESYIEGYALSVIHRSEERA